MTAPETLALAGSLALALGRALALTLVVEMALAALLGLRRAHELAAVALVNIFTNPALNLGLTAVVSLTGSRSLVAPAVLPALVAGELLVVLAEWRLLAYALPRRARVALPLSLAINAASLLAGLLLFGVDI